MNFDASPHEKCKLELSPILGQASILRMCSCSLPISLPSASWYSTGGDIRHTQTALTKKGGMITLCPGEIMGIVQQCDTFPGYNLGPSVHRHYDEPMMSL